MTENPLLKESSLDFHYPPFDKIKDAHFAPAYEQGMAEQLKEIEPIAANPAPPTFENTIVALEKTGELLGRGRPHFFQSLEREHQSRPCKRSRQRWRRNFPRTQDAIYLERPALQARSRRSTTIATKLGLDAESKWLLERYYKDFVRAGAKLSDADKTKLKKMNAELAELADEVFAERPEGEKR